jgi:hypothetical protein
MTRRIKIRERCWSKKRTWGECDSNLIANDTRHGYCDIKKGGNIQQCEYHGIVMLLDKQLAFIEAKAKEYFQLHNEPQKTCCKVLKVIPWSYVLQKIFKPCVHSLAIHTMTKQMWESSKKIKIKHFTFTFQLHQSHKPKQENNLGQTWHKLATSHKRTCPSLMMMKRGRLCYRGREDKRIL